MFELVASTVDGRWQLGIGDPSPLGWFTAFAYAATALMCLIRFLRNRSQRDCEGIASASERRFWFGLFVGLLLLGINKQLDLQTALTQVGRDLALQQGWYDQRRAVQFWFVVVIGLSGVISLGVLVGMLRGAVRRHFLAVIGLVFLFCFVVVRAASFHHIDEYLHLQTLGLPMNAVLELGGIGCVFVSATLPFFRKTNAAYVRNTTEQQVGPRA